MAAIGPKYERSAVDIISPMLTINQQMAAKNESRWNKIKEGVKGLSSGITEAVSSIMAVNKRKEAIEYKGDGYLADLERQLAEAQAELAQVENSMRTIKAEDLGSLDEFIDASAKQEGWNPPMVFEADVDKMEIDGPREFPLGESPNVPFKGGL